MVMDLPMVGANSCPPISYSFSYWVAETCTLLRHRHSRPVWGTLGAQHGDGRASSIISGTAFPSGQREETVASESLNLFRLHYKAWVCINRKVHPTSCSERGFHSVTGRGLWGKRQKIAGSGVQVNLNFQSHEVQCTLHIIEQNKNDAPCQEMKEQPSHTAEVLCLNEYRFDFYKIV